MASQRTGATAVHPLCKQPVWSGCSSDHQPVTDLCHQPVAVKMRVICSWKLVATLATLYIVRTASILAEVRVDPSAPPRDSLDCLRTAAHAVAHLQLRSELTHSAGSVRRSLQHLQPHVLTLGCQACSSSATGVILCAWTTPSCSAAGQTPLQASGPNPDTGVHAIVSGFFYPKGSCYTLVATPQHLGSPASHPSHYLHLHCARGDVRSWRPNGPQSVWGLQLQLYSSAGAWPGKCSSGVHLFVYDARTGATEAYCCSQPADPTDSTPPISQPATSASVRTSEVYRGAVWAVAAIGLLSLYAVCRRVLGLAHSLWPLQDGEQQAEASTLTPPNVNSIIQPADVEAEWSRRGAEGRALVQIDAGRDGQLPPLCAAACLPFSLMSASQVSLGKVIGQGSFGTVYQGSWHGMLVAVKVIDSILEPWTGQGPAPAAVAELALAHRLHHPNIVRTLQYFPAPTAPPPASASALAPAPAPASPLAPATPPCQSRRRRPSEGEVWIVQELCDEGSLGDALCDGRFCPPRDAGGLDVHFTLLRALDVAQALNYLHGAGVCHGDVKAKNVLLCSDADDPYGCIAKLGDFGLSCAFLAAPMEGTIDGGSWANHKAGPGTYPGAGPGGGLRARLGTGSGAGAHLGIGPGHGVGPGLGAGLGSETDVAGLARSTGTVTHAAPERLRSRVVTPAVDMYAFGVLLYELVSPNGIYPGLSCTEVAERVLNAGMRPLLPAYVPPEYSELAASCWQEQPGARPPAAAAEQALLGMLARSAELQVHVEDSLAGVRGFLSTLL